MRIAVCAPYRTVSPHFETELELCELHVAAGDQVDFLACWGELANCEFNPDKQSIACQECQGRRRHGLSVLSGKVRQLTLGHPIPSGDMVPPSFRCTAELRQYKWGSFDLGYGVLSSLISHLRDPEPDLTIHGPLVTVWLQAALQTYLGARDYLQRSRPDRVYLFNGRFAAMRAVLRACQELQVECLVHERGCDLHHYALFENQMPHDIPEMQRRMQQHWDQASPAERARLGADWFIQRRARVEKNWHSFTAGQTPGKLPAQWPVDAPVVTIFGSSDDEFAAIGDCWNNELYANQWEGLERISNSLWHQQSPLRICFRMHPNLAKTENPSKQRFLQHNFPNVFVLPPDDDTDSYAVMEASQQVMSFGSSMGAESVYWGQPTLLLGPCYYQDLPGVTRARRHNQVLDWLAHPIKPVRPEGILIYGYWLQTFGTRFVYFEPESLFHGRFKGQVIYNRPERKRWWRFWRRKQ